MSRRAHRVRWLPRRPPDAGVYEADNGLVTGWCAAVPGAHDEWAEGPVRTSVDAAVRDLRAELELRRWLAERPEPAIRTTPLEGRREPTS